MTEKYIYADVEKPFHFWVREGQRWILREAGAHIQAGAHRTASNAPGRNGTSGKNSGNA